MILASQSPQRHAILNQLGLAHTVMSADVDELGDGDPQVVVVANAVAKARVVAESSKGELVIGADTAVVCDGRILGKPTDQGEAVAFLRMLAGRGHLVYGGLAVIDKFRERTAHAVTTVVFRELSDSDIDAYIASGEWRERAGGYAIQGLGAALIERIEGDYLNVVGLPVAQLVQIAPELFA